MIISNYKLKVNKKNTNGGFTLIELMVSMAIFMIVMLMALGALVNISNVAKKARAMHQAMDNVNFAMESMTRSLRTGSSYYCGTITVPYSTTPPAFQADCPGGGDAISFIPQEQPSKAQDTVYKLEGGALKKCVAPSASCIAMTSSDVSVTDLKFFVKGSGLPAPLGSDTTQPSVYIMMKGVVTIGNDKSEFALQTLVSQRSSE